MPTTNDRASHPPSRCSSHHRRGALRPKPRGDPEVEERLTRRRMEPPNKLSYDGQVNDEHSHAAIQAKIREILQHGPSLRLAILFGSRARGNARPDSDVDIGILPSDPALSLTQELALAGELERAVGAPVDLVRLDQASPTLRWRVARDGVVLHAEPATEAPRFLARVGIEHDAVRELESEAMRRYRARLAAGAGPSR